MLHNIVLMYILGDEVAPKLPTFYPNSNSCDIEQQEDTQAQCMDCSTEDSNSDDSAAGKCLMYHI